MWIDCAPAEGTGSDAAPGSGGAAGETNGRPLPFGGGPSDTIVIGCAAARGATCSAGFALGTSTAVAAAASRAAAGGWRRVMVDGGSSTTTVPEGAPRAAVGTSPAEGV